MDEKVLAMSDYFETEGLQYHRGRPKTSFPGTLDTHLQRIGMRLKTWADMEKLRRIALNRTELRILHKTILQKRCTKQLIVLIQGIDTTRNQNDRPTFHICCCSYAKVIIV